VGKWLHQLELTPLQPRPFHPKRDPAAQEAFKQDAEKPLVGTASI
jgi:transposase